VGFNADEEKIEDLVQSCVIDPTKVVRVAIQNASSIAGLLLTTEALISELPEKPKAGHAGHGPEGGYPDFD
jgi:chaperonin GroEL